MAWKLGDPITGAQVDSGWLRPDTLAETVSDWLKPQRRETESWGPEYADPKSYWGDNGILMSNKPEGEGLAAEPFKLANGNVGNLKNNGIMVDTGIKWNDVENNGFFSLSNPLITFAALVGGGMAATGSGLFAGAAGEAAGGVGAVNSFDSGAMTALTNTGVEAGSTAGGLTGAEAAANYFANDPGMLSPEITGNVAPAATEAMAEQTAINPAETIGQTLGQETAGDYAAEGEAFRGADTQVTPQATTPTVEPASMAEKIAEVNSPSSVDYVNTFDSGAMTGTGGSGAGVTQSKGLISTVLDLAKQYPGIAAGIVSSGLGALGGVGKSILDKDIIERKAELDLKNKEDLAQFYRSFIQGSSAGGIGVKIGFKAPARQRPLRRPDGSLVYQNGLIASHR